MKQLLKRYKVFIVLLLTEVPVMLMLVKIANSTRKWFR